jgi:hypothetical protein
MPHPAYSPDLIPCDFWFFGSVKECFKGKAFPSSSDIEARPVIMGMASLSKGWPVCSTNGKGDLNGALRTQDTITNKQMGPSYYSREVEIAVGRRLFGPPLSFVPDRRSNEKGDFGHGQGALLGRQLLQGMLQCFVRRIPHHRKLSLQIANQSFRDLDLALSRPITMSLE